MAIPYSAILVGGVLMVLACIEFIGKKVEEYRQILRESSADGGKA
jgi:TRAP-type C4-dicarboxylate transport system permease small subunit